MTEAELLALQPGIRLRVPFGAREITAYLLAVAAETDVPTDSLKPALEILDPAPLPTPAVLQLCQWAATYYHHPPGEVFSAIFPTRLRQGKPHQSAGKPGWQLTASGQGLPPGAPAR